MFDLDKKEQEIIVENSKELLELYKEIPEPNIGFAYSKIGYPKLLHVIRVAGRCTIREMDIELLKRVEPSGD